MSDSKIPSAESSFPNDGPVARASGRGAVAAAGKGDTAARGPIVAAVSKEGKVWADGQVPDETEAVLRADFEAFSNKYQEEIRKCIAIAHQSEFDSAKALEMAEEIWLKNAVAECRRGNDSQVSAVKFIAKALVTAAPKVLATLLATHT